MKYLAVSFFAFFILIGCGQKTDQHPGHGDMEESPNRALYEQVMDIHNEVMPKMDEVYKAKVKLTTRLNESPGPTESEKQDLRKKIAQRDSANENMMAGMREFDPLPDSAGEDKARVYLENELKKVTEIREKISHALAEAQPEK
jgi:hypothetical protein